MKQGENLKVLTLSAASRLAPISIRSEVTLSALSIILTVDAEESVLSNKYLRIRTHFAP